MSKPTDEDLAKIGMVRFEPTKEDVQKMEEMSNGILRYMISEKCKVTEVSKVAVVMVVKMFEMLKDSDMPEEVYKNHVDFFANTAIAAITYLQDGHIPDDMESFVNRGRGGEGLN